MKRINEPLAKRENRPVLLKNNNPQGNPHNAPRCEAKTRRGTACMAPAMANGRCRMHGGKSTGPRTQEGLARSRRANWKHGYYSKEAIEERRLMREFIKECKYFVREIS